MTILRGQEGNIEDEESRQRDIQLMASVRDAESECERYSKIVHKVRLQDSATDCFLDMIAFQITTNILE